MNQRQHAFSRSWWLVSGTIAAGIIGLVVFTQLRGVDLEASARRAEEYLKQRGADLDPGMLLILDYLDRRFGLPWVRPGVARIRSQRGACPEGSPEPCTQSHVAGAFIRLIEPTARLTAAEIAALPNTTDNFTAVGLYCQANGLPATFVQDVEQQLTSGNDAAHAAMGLQWAIEQGCLDPKQPEVAALRQRLLDQLVKKAEGVPADASIEAIAFLAYLGEWKRVRSAWLETMVRAQNETGAWVESPHPAGQDHTTTLALWVLLEATRQGAPVTWVPPAPRQPDPGSR